MSENKNILKASKPKFKYTESEMIAKFEADPFFIEKDRQAIQFLEKHPIPDKFRK